MYIYYFIYVLLYYITYVYIIYCIYIIHYMILQMLKIKKKIKLDNNQIWLIGTVYIFNMLGGLSFTSHFW